MNPVGQLLTLDDIRLDFDASLPKQVLGEIATLLAARNGLTREIILESLMTREQLGSTGMGHGVAIPHARMPRCATPAGAFVRTKVPIAFGAPDGKPVSVFLGLIVPDKAMEGHLQLLAAAAAMFSDRSFRGALKTNPDAAQVRDLLAAWSEAGATPA
jgi:PTS system nitrogen regulatory IIA component